MDFTHDAIERAKRVKLIILDVDGVLTRGDIFVSDSAEYIKAFYCRDGLAITVSRKFGIQSAIITGRQSPPTAYRAKELHIEHFYQGKLDKREAYKDLKAKTGLTDEEIAYIGDDLVDLPIMGQVGFPAAVGDAVPEVKEAAVFTSGFEGGHGAVRETIEFILKAQGLWADVLSSFGVKPKGDISNLVQ